MEFLDQRQKEGRTDGRSSHTRCPTQLRKERLTDFTSTVRRQAGNKDRMAVSILVNQC